MQSFGGLLGSKISLNFNVWVKLQFNINLLCSSNLSNRRNPVVLYFLNILVVIVRFLTANSERLSRYGKIISHRAKIKLDDCGVIFITHKSKIRNIRGPICVRAWVNGSYFCYWFFFAPERPRNIITLDNRFYLIIYYRHQWWRCNCYGNDHRDRYTIIVNCHRFLFWTHREQKEAMIFIYSIMETQFNCFKMNTP